MKDSWVNKVKNIDLSDFQNKPYCFRHPKLLDYEDIKQYFSPFIESVSYEKDTHLDMRQYAGTDHMGYSRKEFESLIKSMKRLRQNLTMLVYSPGYYFNKEHKGFTLASFNNRAILVSQGNHRMVIAKHLYSYLGIKPYLYGVSIYTYHINWKYYYFYHALKKVLKRKYMGLWVAYSKKRISYTNPDELADFGLFIFSRFYYMFHRHHGISAKLKDNEMRAYGFIFDENNISILKNLVRLGSKGVDAENFNFCSPEVLLDLLLSERLGLKTSYGYQVRFNCYDRTSIQDLDFNRMEEHLYYYLENKAPYYTNMQLLFLIISLRLYRKPIKLLKDLLGYIKVRKLIVNRFFQNKYKKANHER